MSSKRLQSRESGSGASNRSSKKHNLNSNHHPVEVLQEDTSATFPVDHKRTIINERKTVLYGQTPPAMCKIQLRFMAEAVGMTVTEFARHVMATETKEHVQLLRQFYAPNLPQLTQLFDELYICAVTESPLQHTVRGRQAVPAGKKPSNDETSTVDETGPRSRKDSITDKKTNTENEIKIAQNLALNYKKWSRTEEKKKSTQMPTRNSYSRKDVLEINFELDKDTQNTIKENISKKDFKTVGKKSRDRSEVPSSNLTQRNRTFISNQKNATHGTSEKYSDLLENGCISRSSLDWEKQHTQIFNAQKKKVKSQINKNTVIPTRMCNSSEIQSLLTEADKMVSSTSVYCQEAKATEKRCANLTCGEIDSHTSQNITPVSSEQNSKIESSDCNTFLVGLLFGDEVTTTNVDKTKCFKNQVLRNSSQDESYDVDHIPSDKTELCKDDSAMNSKATGHYNKILDTILFGESSSQSESVPEQSGIVANSISPTQLTNASSQLNHSFNPSKHSRNTTDELFDS